MPMSAKTVQGYFSLGAVQWLKFGPMETLIHKMFDYIK